MKKAWGVKQVETIKMIQKILSNAPVLEHPNWDRPFTVATDASQFGIGAVLYQKDKDDKMHIIHLHAQSFTKGQKNYLATKCELLAMIAPLKKWRHILMGRKFTIEVDHKALEYIHSSTQYMVLEWLDFLLNFDFTVTYKKGIDHVLPDYLSRLYEKPLEEGNNEVKEGEILFSAANLEADELAPEKTKQFMENFLKNGANKKLVTDPEERATLITNCHQESHQGGVGMFHKLFQDGFWWEDMLKDCMSTAKTCIDCLRYNTGRVGFHPLKPVTATLLMDHVVWDLADMRRSGKGFKFILILVDVATKFMFLRALKTKAAEEIAPTLLEIISNFGFPKIIQSDQDDALENKVLKRLREEGGWELRRVMTYFPSQNRAVERVVQEVKKLIFKIWVHDENWEKFVPAVQLSLNDRVVSRHNSSPFALMFARGLNQSCDYSSVVSDIASEKELLDRNFKMVSAVYPAIQWKSLKSGEKDCEQKNKRKKEKIFQPGDFVMKLVDKRDNKEDPKWEGPLRVVKREPGTRGYVLEDKTGACLNSAVAASRLQRSALSFDGASEGIFEIRKILEHRGKEKRREYKIWWKGYPRKEVTWVKEKDIHNNLVIKEYWKKNGKSNSSSPRPSQ